MTVLLHSHYVNLWTEHFTKTKATKMKYYYALRKFEEYLLLRGYEGTLDFDKFHADKAYPDRFLPIQNEFMQDFFLYLVEEKHASANLHANTVIALRNFFSFLFDSELISHNPLSLIPTPKYEKKIMNTALSNNEIKKLLKAATFQDPFYKKYWCLIIFMLETGLRAEELCSLKRMHVNLSRQTVYVNEQSKTEANSVVMSIQLTKEISRYVSHPEYLRFANNGDEFLFSINGNKMTAEKLRTLLKVFSQQAELTRIVKPHDLRRTTGYLMQKKGIHPLIISRQLRHKQISTTLYYLPPFDEMSEILESDQYNTGYVELTKINNYFNFEE